MAGYDTIGKLEESEGLGTVYATYVVVTNTYMDADGTRGHQECVYWDDDGDDHPFTGYFADLDEARAFARTFGQAEAEWTHENGNGPQFMGVSLDLVRYERDEKGELGEGQAIMLREWLNMNDFEEIMLG